MIEQIKTGLEAHISARTDITLQERDRMFSLLGDYFDGYRRSNFERDLDEKHEVLFLRNKNGDIQGFTTILFLETKVDEEKVRGIFSGDTIVSKEYWNENTLAREWSRYMLEVADRSKERLFWFLICSGFRTYRFLPTFFKEFFPRYERLTPNFEQQVLDTFAAIKFPGEYNPKTGLVTFGSSTERLKEGIGEITQERLSNPNINYFVTRNPNHAQGAELACLTEISKRNYKPSALRRFGIEV